jgi:hypothetical protein
VVVARVVLLKGEEQRVLEPLPEVLGVLHGEVDPQVPLLNASRKSTKKNRNMMKPVPPRDDGQPMNDRREEQQLHEGSVAPRLHLVRWAEPGQAGTLQGFRNLERVPHVPLHVEEERGGDILHASTKENVSTSTAFICKRCSRYRASKAMRGKVLEMRSEFSDGRVPRQQAVKVGKPGNEKSSDEHNMEEKRIGAKHKTGAQRRAGKSWISVKKRRGVLVFIHHRRGKTVPAVKRTYRYTLLEEIHRHNST